MEKAETTVADALPKLEKLQAVFQVEYDLVYEFKISRCRAGSFKNLWRLQAKTPEGKKLEEIIDADMLSTVIDRIRYIFEADGL
jgi:hypothetical protein